MAKAPPFTADKGAKDARGKGKPPASGRGEDDTKSMPPWLRTKGKSKGKKKEKS